MAARAAIAVLLLIGAPASAQTSTSQCYWLAGTLNCTTYTPEPMRPGPTLDTSIPERAARGAAFDIAPILEAQARRRAERERFVVPPEPYVAEPYVEQRPAPKHPSPKPAIAPPPPAKAAPPPTLSGRVRCVTCTR